MADESEAEFEAKVAEMMEKLAPIEQELDRKNEKSSANDDWWSSIEDAFKLSSEEEQKQEFQSAGIDTSLETMVRRILKKPHLPRLDPLPDNVVIAAETFPGFSSDLTRWNLTIDGSGTLHQNVLICTPENSDAEPYSENVEIGKVEVERLLKLAIDLDFVAFRPVVETITTDVGSYQLWFRLNGKIVTYVADGGGELSEEHEKSFRRLWQEIQRYAPFPKREN